MRKGLQYGLTKFFGTPEQKAASQPVSDLQLTPFHRSHKSRAQLEFEASKAAFEALVAEKEAEEGEDRAHEIAKSRRLTQGKRFTRVAPEAGKRKPQKGRIEMTANRKKLIAQDLAEFQQDAEDKETRAQKLSKSKAYRRSFTEKLLRWTKAKFTTSEVVSNISSLESQVRCKLTWQEFDWCLWLASLSSLAELSSEKRVADPEDFLKHRTDLAIGFSDQVPLWAKATGRKAVFAQEELHSAETTKDFSEVRQAIEDVMKTDSDATFEVVPISDTGDSTPRVQKALSFGSEGSGTVRKALSFSSLSPEKPQLAEDQAEEQQQPRLRHSQKGPELQQAKKKQKALPKAGAKTTLGFSADERFRITYEARQVLLQVVAEPSKPVIGLVGKGLLVVPGQWARWQVDPD